MLGVKKLQLFLACGELDYERSLLVSVVSTSISVFGVVVHTVQFRWLKLFCLPPQLISVLRCGLIVSLECVRLMID